MKQATGTELLNSIMQNRRSVFPYQFERGRRVPDEIIRKILDNANRAPTHKKTEPWRFTVFAGEGLQHFPNLQAVLYTRFAGDKFKETKLLNLTNYPLMSSHVIAIGMKRNKENAIPEIEEVIATACAIENIYLTVTAYELGGYLSTGGITYFEESKPYFDLEPADKLLGFFYIGYPAATPAALSKRQPVEDKTKWVVE